MHAGRLAVCDVLAIGGEQDTRRGQTWLRLPQVPPEEIRRCMTDDASATDAQRVTVLLSLPLPCLLCGCQQAAVAASVVPDTPAWWGEQPGKTRLGVAAGRWLCRRG